MSSCHSIRKVAHIFRLRHYTEALHYSRLYPMRTCPYDSPESGLDNSEHLWNWDCFLPWCDSVTYAKISYVKFNMIAYEHVFYGTFVNM